MKPFFTSEDFQDHQFFSQDAVAQVANAKLEQEAKVVYGYEQSGHWYCRSNSDMAGQTHQARLINIQPIEKKCEHKGGQLIEYVHGHPTSPIEAKCLTCGVELVAEWRAK